MSKVVDPTKLQSLKTLRAYNLAVAKMATPSQPSSASSSAGAQAKTVRASTQKPASEKRD